MRICCNGESLVVDQGDLVSVLKRYGLTLASGGIAVAINEILVPRSMWPDTSVKDGDSIEILHAIQGG